MAIDSTVTAAVAERRAKAGKRRARTRRHHTVVAGNRGGCGVLMRMRTHQARPADRTAGGPVTGGVVCL